MNDVHGDIEADTQPVFRASMAGYTRPPADMMGAAQKSLSSQGFTDLMNQTGGATPTPAQLCAAVELERSLGRAPTT